MPLVFSDSPKRELPFVEQTFTAMADDTQAQTDMLNGYTADFIGATLLRWDELRAKYWRMFWSGF